MEIIINHLTRSLGQNDAYPFVLTPIAIEKLRYVHDCIGNHQLGTVAGAPQQ